jgi:hypothetical protein
VVLPITPELSDSRYELDSFVSVRDRSFTTRTLNGRVMADPYWGLWVLPALANFHARSGQGTFGWNRAKTEADQPHHAPDFALQSGVRFPLPGTAWSAS